MIRTITVNDKEQILRLVEMFFKEHMESINSYYSPQHGFEHFDIFINNPAIIALCFEEPDGRIVGLIVGMLSMILFAKELAMQEMIWYVEPEKRKCGLKLFRAFEERAAQVGASRIIVTGFSNTDLVGLYPKLGYIENQRIFMKGIK